MFRQYMTSCADNKNNNITACISARYQQLWNHPHSPQRLMDWYKFDGVMRLHGVLSSVTIQQIEMAGDQVANANNTRCRLVAWGTIVLGLICIGQSLMLLLSVSHETQVCLFGSYYLGLCFVSS